MDTATVNTEVGAQTIPIYIMGKRYDVPETLTIMKAMEHAGYQYIRGCGCRGGVCGACATVYRKAGDYKIYTGLACQTVVEPEMHLTQIPFFPANRAHVREAYRALRQGPLDDDELEWMRRVGKHVYGRSPVRALAD